MTIDTEIKSYIIKLLRGWYPDWSSVSDPLFQKNEVLYKQEAMEKISDLIGRSELESLLTNSEYDEFLDRLDKAGKLTNQLWIRVPMEGDLNVLYQENLDKEGYCRAVYDLLYGEGSGEERLGRYIDYLVTNELPNNWTFPTYLLFYGHPDSEIFVKPMITQWWLRLLDSPKHWSSEPNAELYSEIKRIARDVLAAFRDEGATNMVDVQSIMWTAARVDQERLLSSDREQEFERLFKEFLDSYPMTVDGQQHLDMYSTCRDTAIANYEEICRLADTDEDITDAVLLKLLPYVDSERNRNDGAWIHWAPTINGDIKKWYEAKGWTRSEDWPPVSQAILQFVHRCMDDAGELAVACKEFLALTYSKGFQTGNLTPILNALQPEDFALVNNKSRLVLNHFAEKNYAQSLEDYPKANDALHKLHNELHPVLSTGEELGLTNGDLFDMFCHWLVAVNKYDFKDSQYWIISPDENAWEWNEFVEGGFIAVGWDEIGDIGTMSRTEFYKAQDRCANEYGWTKVAIEQVWRFANHIREGDHILATRCNTELLGVGTVVGPYYYIEGAKQAHRRSVEWDDLTTREIDEEDWASTLLKTDRDKFEQLTSAPPTTKQPDAEARKQLAKPFSDIFPDWDEAEWAFDFLHHSMDLLGVTGPDDKRCALTLPKNQNEKLLRFNFGQWQIIDFSASSPGVNNTVKISLLADSPVVSGYRNWTNAGEPKVDDVSLRVFSVPIADLLSDNNELKAHINRSLESIGPVFANWHGTSHSNAHQQAIMEAVFDSEKRENLLLNGLELVVNDVEVKDINVHPECPFSQRTFELLEQINETPTAAFYQEHKQAFIQDIEEPIKRVMHSVAAQLPEQIKQLLETERYLFSKFQKNDFGQGGAWPHYWGAFYPKGSKRSQDAQLSMWMNYQYLDFGFFIGHYGSVQRQRFEASCRRFHHALVEILTDSLSTPELLFGARDTFTVLENGQVIQEEPISWQDFLGNPEQHYPDVSLVISAHEVLQMSESEIVDQVLKTHMRLFPLVLLAVEDDPLPAIQEYLEVDHDDESSVADIYLLSQCAEETGFHEEELERWVRAIRRKGQAIFYGPPGTGKTYIARKLADHLIGGGDGFVDLVQFHPAYAYEDFMQGIRPQSNGDQLTYPVVQGRFLDFCSEARRRKGPCVLIVDEINRANLAHVFGELMYLLEYRDESIPLAGGGRKFSIPNNVYIIGTMNTADRSIALVDHALRRRFAFLALYPNYEVLERYHEQHKTGFPVSNLVIQLVQLNRRISDKHYSVGISFFLRTNLSEEIGDVWQAEIEPYLDEYFFDNIQRADEFRWDKLEEKIFGHD